VTATRDRIVDAAAELFRLHGYAGTGMKQVVTAAEAPFGSVYHFFPGGKQELAAAAIERAGAFYGDLVMAIIDAEDDIVAGTRAVFDGAADVLVDTGYADACPIATVGLEVASTNEELRAACDRVFGEWTEVLAGRIVDGGATPAAGRSAAIAVIALLEGAFLLSRTARTTEAMRATGDAAVATVAAAVGRPVP
jgi:AcrR family transcriptional regulator